MEAMKAIKAFEWKQCMELGYMEGDDSNDVDADPICFQCGKAASSQDKPLARCAKCHTVSYCSRACQVKNWKKGASGGHKFCCSYYKRVGDDMMIALPDDKETARQDLFQRIRFYACPFYVHRSSVAKSPGFLFLQSDSTLAEMSLPTPKLPNGRDMTKTRSILLHFLTLEEYDKELCKDDFEMATVRTELNAAIDTFDDKKEIVVMMKFRCGHAAVGVGKLVPDHALCTSLGKEYYGKLTDDAVQLNLDDL